MTKCMRLQTLSAMQCGNGIIHLPFESELATSFSQQNTRQFRDKTSWAPEVASLLEVLSIFVNKKICRRTERALMSESSVICLLVVVHCFAYAHNSLGLAIPSVMLLVCRWFDVGHCLIRYALRLLHRLVNPVDCSHRFNIFNSFKVISVVLYLDLNYVSGVVVFYWSHNEWQCDPAVFLDVLLCDITSVVVTDTNNEIEFTDVLIDWN